MSDDTQAAEQDQDAGETAPEGSALGSTVAGEPPIGDEPDASAAFKGSED